MYLFYLMYMYIVPDFHFFLFPSVYNIFLVICVKYHIWDKVWTKILDEKAKYF